MGWFSWFRRRSSRVKARDLAPGQESFGLFRRSAGRQMVQGVPYALPKDMGEANRLDLQHYIARYALRGNYLAPIGTGPGQFVPHEILDVGTGTGRWAREVAVAFPQANVVGTDIVPPPVDVQSDQGVGPDPRPDNYTFLPGNVLEGLPFDDASFDFTHMRLLYAGIPKAQWSSVVADLVRVTRPGGWVELLEGGLWEHDPRRPAPATDQVNAWVTQIWAFRKLDIDIARRLGSLLADAGLAQVHFFCLRIPVGLPTGQLGALAKLMESNSTAALQGVGALVVPTGLATDEEYQATLAAMNVEVHQQPVFFPYYVAYGQRVQ